MTFSFWIVIQRWFIGWNVGWQMMRIAIADDSIDLCEIAKSIIMESVTKNVSITCFPNPKELMYDLDEGIEYDVYFLDIEMPQIDGITLAKYIREKQKEAWIVFLTSHSELALVGYDIDIQAKHFIVKGQMKNKIPDLMKHFENLMDEKKHYYTIQSNVRFTRINCEEIRYIHKVGKNVEIVTGSDKYYERKTLNQILEELNMPEIIMIERGFLANIRHVSGISSNMITLDTGEELFISRSKIKEVKQKVNEYWINRI